MKKITIRLSFILLATISLAQSQPAGKTSVAIYPIKAAGSADKATASALTALLSSELAPSPRLYVIEETMLRAVMERQAMNASDACDDTSCQVEIGKLVKAQKIITGDIVKLGTLYILSLKLINVQTGAMEFSTKDQCECTENQLLQLVAVAGAKVRNRFGDAVPVQKLPQASSITTPIKQQDAAQPVNRASQVAQRSSFEINGNTLLTVQDASDCSAYQGLLPKQKTQLQNRKVVYYKDFTQSGRNANREARGMMIAYQTPDKVWEFLTHPSNQTSTGVRFTVKESNKDGYVAEFCIGGNCYQVIYTYDFNNGSITGRLDPGYKNAILDYKQSTTLYSISETISLVDFTVYSEVNSGIVPKFIANMFIEQAIFFGNKYWIDEMGKKI